MSGIYTTSVVRRVVQLYGGLVCFGVSLAVMVRARLGLGPWDVVHQGVARHLHLAIGTVVILVSVVVMMAWIPLRQRPGIGTVSNAVLVGLVVNAGITVIPSPASLAVRLGMLAVAIALNGVATGLYIGARFGPGPRDGLMTGIAARGHPMWFVRAVIEGTLLVIGLALGGTIGIGTIAYAAAIGPLAHHLVPRLSVPRTGAACA